MAGPFIPAYGCSDMDTLDKCLNFRACGWCPENQTIGKCIDVICGPDSANYSRGLASECNENIVFSIDKINSSCLFSFVIQLLIMVFIGLIFTQIGSMIGFSAISRNKDLNHTHMCISGILAITSAVICGLSVTHPELSFAAIIFSLILPGVGILMYIIRWIKDNFFRRDEYYPMASTNILY